MTGLPKCTVLENVDRDSFDSRGNPDEFWSLAFPPHSEANHLWDVARDCLENIGTLRSQRKPLSHENWNTPLKAEQRLLDQVDAVLACGEGVIRRAVEAVRESEIPDPEWAFAVMFVLGCISGDEKLQSAQTLLEVLSERNADETDAAVEALSYAPNPKIGTTFSGLLEGGSTKSRASAAKLLFWRGELSATQIEKLLRSKDPELLVPALHSLVERTASIDASQWISLLHDDSEAVVRAALCLSFANRQSSGRQRALELIGIGRPQFADAALWLALSGDHRDWAFLKTLLESNPTPLIIRSAGYWGYAEAIPLLLGLLKRASDVPPADIASAIERITAAGLSRWDPDSQELQLAPAEPYERWWHDRARHFHAGMRFRCGRPFASEVLLEELEKGTHTQEERTITHLELVSRYDRRPPRFRPDDFIRRQQESILEWKRLLTTSSKL
jgi:hypothetical protein